MQDFLSQFLLESDKNMMKNIPCWLHTTIRKFNENTRAAIYVWQ